MVQQVASLQQAILEGDNIVVKFGAEWCAACKAIAPAFEALPEEFKNVLFADIDADSNTDFVISMGIKSLPSFAFYKNGELQSIEKGLTHLQLKERASQLN